MECITLGGLDDPIIKEATSFIEEKGLTNDQASEIQGISGTLKSFGIQDKEDLKHASVHGVKDCHSNTITQVGEEFLEKHLGMKNSPVAIESVSIIGQGYNILNDRPVPSQAMQFQTTIQDGVVIPTCASRERINESKTFMEYLEEENQVVNSRMKKLNINLDVDYKLFSFEARAGFTSATNATMSSTNKEYSFLLERRDFKLKLANFKHPGISFTEEFKDDIQGLPATYEKTSPDCRSAFERFFNTWGHFVVTDAFGGGSVEVKVISPSFTSGESSFHQIKASLASFSGGTLGVSGSVDGSSTTDGSINTNTILNQSTMNWSGGSPELHMKKTLTDDDAMLKWRLSNMTKPTMLSTEMSLEPISTMIKCVDRNKDTSSYKALEDLLGGKFGLMKSREKEAEKRAEDLRKQKEEEQRAADAKTRADAAKAADDAANTDSGGGSCLLGKCCILMVDYKWVAIEKLTGGDTILDKNLQPVKVLATNHSFLGARRLFSFGKTGPIFTGEHQFISSAGSPVVVDRADLFNENPQLIEENVEEMYESTKILAYEAGKGVRPVDINLVEHNKYPSNTKVFFVEVEGDGTYIVDNYVAKHELPNFEKWPLTFLTLGLTAMAVDIKGKNSLDMHNIDLPLLVPQKSSRKASKSQYFRPVLFLRCGKRRAAAAL